MITGLGSGKHLYSRGWLGLIPLVGGFVGLGLIALGVLKYKDRKLALIGTAALLFTVLIYSSIYYYFEYSDSFRKGFSQFSQPYMDQVVKNLEFFKNEHGQYPDSLQELTNKGNLVRIHDPIAQGRDGYKGQFFFYQRVDTNYFLFSVGVDRKPFTDDDIFPSSQYFDSTRTGLIKPRK